MPGLTTTLNKIREHAPCGPGWEILLASLDKTKADDEPLALLWILDSNGLDDALWALRAVDGHDNAKRALACFYAKYSLDIFERKYPDDKRPRLAIETAERYAHGQATNDELSAARDAAWAATWAVWAAARAAARDAAWAAARAAARDAWAAARAAAVDAARAAAGDAWAAAGDHFSVEFIRLCRLEGEYGELDKNKAPEAATSEA